MATYLIIGSGTGIGKQIVENLQKEGSKVLQAGRENRHGSSDFLQVDVTKPESFPDLDQPLDGLAYCPGSITLKPFKSLKEEDFLRDYELNLLGAFRVLQKYLPLLQQRERSSVVLFSTVAVGLGLPYHASIAAAKGAVEGFTRSLAAELAPKVRVNCIAPSLTDTPLATKLLDTEAKRKSAEDRHPLKQVGNPADVASLACWLLGENSKFVTAQVWNIDGGLGSLKVGP